MDSELRRQDFHAARVVSAARDANAPEEPSAQNSRGSHGQVNPQENLSFLQRIPQSVQGARGLSFARYIEPTDRSLLLQSAAPPLRPRSGPRRQISSP